MKKSIKVMVVSFSGVVVLGLLSFSYAGGEWKVPDTDKNVKNAVKSDKVSIDAGAVLYAKHCKSCHGKTGEGDGPKATELKGELSDFTQSKFQSQTDGALFYKINKGRDEMPSFAKKISEEDDVWSIINYMRTFGKK